MLSNCNRQFCEKGMSQIIVKEEERCKGVPHMQFWGVRIRNEQSKDEYR